MRPLNTSQPRRQSGFTLLEMAVVVFIIAVVLGSILLPLSNQVEQRQFVDTQRQLEDIREALIGYALAQTKPYLPCPDKADSSGSGTPNDGVEDVNADGTCVDVEGNVPWVTLGVTAVDPWGHRIRYRVSQSYANHSTPFTLAATGDLQLCAASATLSSCDAGQVITETTAGLNKPAAVLISHGANGWGSIDPVTNARLLPPGCSTPVGCAAMTSNEIANADGTLLFVSRPPSPTTSSVGQFDDIVIWISPHVLKQRMVGGGRLP